MSRLYRIALIVLAVSLCALVPASAWAVDAPNRPSSGELVEQPKIYNGAAISFTGEAIGEVMVRGTHAWLHLNDDAYMYTNVEEGAALGGYNSGMPVWIDAEKTGVIEYYGDYQHSGDIVEVEGMFNAACAEHGGDMDIHATGLKLVVTGRDAADPVRPWKAALAVVLSIVAAGVRWADRRAGHREMTGLQQSR